jgi:hypothetical protein
LLRDRRPQEAGRSHLVEDCAIRIFVTESVLDSRGKLLLAVLMRRVLYLTLFEGELGFEVEGAGPGKFAALRHDAPD